jgi:hypothetical protein
MKTMLPALAFALAGCAAATMPPSAAHPGDPRLAEMLQQSREIAAHEQRCIDQGSARAADRIAMAAANHDAFTALQIQAAAHEQSREIARCRAKAERANGALSSSERSEYERQARQEHDRAAQMMILTASHPR